MLSAPLAKGLNLTHPSFARMRLAVEADETPHPVALGLLGPYAIVLKVDAVAELFKQPPREWSRGLGKGAIVGGFASNRLATSR